MAARRNTRCRYKYRLEPKANIAGRDMPVKA